MARDPFEPAAAVAWTIRRLQQVLISRACARDCARCFEAAFARGLVGAGRRRTRAQPSTRSLGCAFVRQRRQELVFRRWFPLAFSARPSRSTACVRRLPAAARYWPSTTAPFDPRVGAHLLKRERRSRYRRVPRAGANREVAAGDRAARVARSRSGRRLRALDARARALRRWRRAGGRRWWRCEPAAGDTRRSRDRRTNGFVSFR